MIGIESQPEASPPSGKSSPLQPPGFADSDQQPGEKCEEKDLISMFRFGHLGQMSSIMSNIAEFKNKRFVLFQRP